MAMHMHSKHHFLTFVHTIILSYTSNNSPEIMRMLLGATWHEFTKTTLTEDSAWEFCMSAAVYQNIDLYNIEWILLLHISVDRDYVNQSCTLVWQTLLWLYYSLFWLVNPCRDNTNTAYDFSCIAWWNELFVKIENCRNGLHFCLC